MYGKVKADIREILRTLCRYKKVEIIEGAVCADHVHLCLSIPPKLAISEFMGYLKGKSALMIFDKLSGEHCQDMSQFGDSGKTDRPFRSSGTLNPLETEQYFSPKPSAPGRWGCAPAA